MKKAILLFALVGVFLTACSKSKVESHTTTGVIVSIENNGKNITIQNQRFADGFMEAMAMPYETVDPALATGLKKGDKVQFTLTKQEDYYPITEIKKIP